MIEFADGDTETSESEQEILVIGLTDITHEL